MANQIHLCSDCIHAYSYVIPKSELQRRIKNARGEYNRPKALILAEVQEGTNTLIARGCSYRGNAYGSSLCVAQSEFNEKYQPANGRISN